MEGRVHGAGAFIGRSGARRLLVGSILAAGLLGAHPAAGIELQPFLSNLSSPVYITHARDGSGRLFVVERAGVIKVVQPASTTPTVFLDITDRVSTSGREQGLLGLTFHPQYP